METLPEVEIRRIVEHGICVRCGRTYEQRKWLCTKCGTPNYTTFPLGSYLITIGPAILIMGFFGMLVGMDLEDARLDQFVLRGMYVAVTLFLVSAALACWIHRMAQRLMRSYQSRLR